MTGVQTCALPISVYGTQSVERCDPGGHCIRVSVSTENAVIGGVWMVRADARIQCNASDGWNHACRGLMGRELVLWRDGQPFYGNWWPNCASGCGQYLSTDWRPKGGTHTWQAVLDATNITTLGGWAYGPWRVYSFAYWY